MTDLGSCRGERRKCSAPAVVVRQGRALCPACDERRKQSKKGRQRRRRKREAEVHDAGECADDCKLCAHERERGRGRPALDPTSPTKVTTLRMPEVLWAQLATAAADEDRAVSECVREALAEWLDRR